MRSFVCFMLICCVGGITAAPALGEVTLTLAGPTEAQAGETGLLYEWYITGTGADAGRLVRGYQVFCPCAAAGGAGGSVDYAMGSVAINIARPDWLFAGIAAVSSPSEAACPGTHPGFLASSLFATDAQPIDGTPQYMGQFGYDVSGTAAGVFTIDLLGPDVQSFLRDPSGNPIPFVSVPAVLTIVECVEDGDCDNDDVCDGLETCVAGECVDGTPLVCDDQNECTADSCDAQDGCQYDPTPGAACGSDADTDCDNPDTCDAAGVCQPNNEPNGTACTDDGLFCNGDETCMNGVCSMHSGDPCVGGGECNEVCNEVADNCFDPAGTACSSDGNVCTDDACDGAGTCGHENNTDPCDDGDLCTENDVCAGGACAGTPKDCDDGDDCTIDTCNPVTGQCVHTNFCEVEVCLDLAAEGLSGRENDPNCVDADGMFKVGIHIGPASNIVGAQFRVVYDTSVMTLVDIGPGSDCDAESPFTNVIDEAMGAGWAWVATETGDQMIPCVDIFDCPAWATGCNLEQGGFCEPIAQPSGGDTDVACLTFEFVEDVCDMGDVCFEDLNPMIGRLVDINGEPVLINHGDLKDCTCETFIPDTPTTIVCPADINVNADCDETTRVLYFDCPYGLDECGDAKVALECIPLTGEPCNPAWVTNCGGEFPQGTWLFMASATDNECPDEEPAVCSFTVTVSSVQTMNVEVQLSPLMAEGPYTRCIEFKLYHFCTPYESFEVVKEDILFGGPYNFSGHGTAEIKVPKGNYLCIQARDQLHTLWNSTDVACEGGVYDALFKGDPFMGGNWLTGGNLDGLAPPDEGWSTRAIDIVDYGIFVSQFLSKPGADTLCADKPAFWQASEAHADINGDGIVDDIDFSFISVNFLQMDKDLKCCPYEGRATSDGWTSITVRELAELGISGACDLNHDGVCDLTDMAAFQDGVRPKPGFRPNHR